MYQTNLMWLQDHLHIQCIISVYYSFLALRQSRKADSLQVFYILPCNPDVILEFSPLIKNASILSVQCSLFQIIFSGILQILQMEIKIDGIFILKDHSTALSKIHILFLQKIAAPEPGIIKTENINISAFLTGCNIIRSLIQKIISKLIQKVYGKICRFPNCILGQKSNSSIHDSNCIHMAGHPVRSSHNSDHFHLVCKRSYFLYKICCPETTVIQVVSIGDCIIAFCNIDRCPFQSCLFYQILYFTYLILLIIFILRYLSYDLISINLVYIIRKYNKRSKIRFYILLTAPFQKSC